MILEKGWVYYHTQGNPANMVNKVDKFQQLYNQYKKKGKPSLDIDQTALAHFKRTCKLYDKTGWPLLQVPPKNLENFASELLQMKKRCEEFDSAREPEREAAVLRAAAPTPTPTPAPAPAVPSSVMGEMDTCAVSNPMYMTAWRFDPATGEFLRRVNVQRCSNEDVSETWSTKLM